MMLVPQTENYIVPPGAQTVTFNSADFSDPSNCSGMFFLNITAASGTTPTLDIKIQNKSDLTGGYVDIPNAAFTQKVGVTTDFIVIAPTIAAVANKTISQFLAKTFRAVVTIGGTTPSFTFSLTYTPA